MRIRRALLLVTAFFPVACAPATQSRIDTRQAIAPAFRYAEGSGAYRVTSTDTSTRSATGQRSDVTWRSTQRLTFTLAKRGADTLDLSVTVDSATMQHSQSGTVDMSRIVGKTATATLAPNGRVMKVNQSGEIAASLAEQLIHFLPYVGASLTHGATWTDTIVSRVVQGGIPVARQIISTQTVVGDTVINGVTGARIERDTRITFSGSGTAAGRAISVTGTATGGGVYVISPGGVFLGMALRNEMVAKTLFVETGMTSDFTSIASSVVARVPDK